MLNAARVIPQQLLLTASRDLVIHSGTGTLFDCIYHLPSPPRERPEFLFQRVRLGCKFSVLPRMFLLPFGAPPPGAVHPTDAIAPHACRRTRGRCYRNGQLRNAEPMPSEGGALVPGDGAGELSLGAVEVLQSDDQQLVALLLGSSRPRAGSLEPAAMRNRGDGHRTHRRDLYQSCGGGVIRSMSPVENAFGGLPQSAWRLRARRLRQHEDGGGDDLRRQGPPVRSPLPADALLLHHLAEPVVCTPASGWEKGQVENQVGLVRERFFTLDRDRTRLTISISAASLCARRRRRPSESRSSMKPRTSAASAAGRSARTASTRSAAGTPPSLRVGALGVAGWDFPCRAAAWSALRFAPDFGDTVKKGSPS